LTTSHSSIYAPGDLIPGTVYRVVRRLAAVGLGAVYEVEDTTVARRFCLKTLDTITGDLEEFRRRLAIEAQTLARLAHPNIVQVITAGVTQDRRLPYFVMELLRGRSLRDTLDAKGALELGHVLDIGTQVLDALDHAHARGVIHRDVKPENIFLHRETPESPIQAKLLDFGVVAFLRAMPGLQEPPGLSPKYAAPELLRAEAATTACDIYSMGLVLYEMLCGHGPFDHAGDLSDIARARLEQAPAPMNAHVPAVLEDLIIGALERDPVLRPTDAFSFAETLRELSGRVSRLPQQGLLSSMPPPSSLPSVSGIPAALVQADWRPPPTPRAGNVERPHVERLADEADIEDADSIPARRSRSRGGAARRPWRREAGGGMTRDTLVGVAVGLALLLVTLVVVMLK
jgi:serine/threonine-protein kinase